MAVILSENVTKTESARKGIKHTIYLASPEYCEIEVRYVKLEAVEYEDFAFLTSDVKEEDIICVLLNEIALHEASGVKVYDVKFPSTLNLSASYRTTSKKGVYSE